MNAYEHILSKQINWARNRGLSLVGSKGARGRPTYTKALTDNLFAPLLPSVEQQIRDGDGGELHSQPGNPSKMHAVHSSSVLGVNVFQHWLAIGDVPAVAAACGLCTRSNRHAKNILFEFKCQISERFQFSPNIDIVIENDETTRFKVFAIESKFSEAYSARAHSGLDPKYLKLNSVWNDIPHIHTLARTISPADATFTHLHAAQLVKHVLGLKTKYGKGGFRLLYLWYDALGHAGAIHRDEVEQFMRVAKKDGVYFHSMTYQELIVRLAKEHSSQHEDYISYVTSRYL